MERKNISKMVSICMFIVALFLIYWIGDRGLIRPRVAEGKISQGTIVFDLDNPEVHAAITAQGRHTPRLMAMRGVVGTAAGLTEAGRAAVVVFAKDVAEARGIPENLEGIPVDVRVVGEIFAIPRVSRSAINPAGYFTTPVPIGVSTGVSTGNPSLDCLAGTISARVKDGTGNVYALSNNHVYALENAVGKKTPPVVQPGLYDANPQCSFDPTRVIGYLYKYVTINFSGSNNTVDAAIASAVISPTPTIPLGLGNSTPSNGYGTPRSATAKATLFQSVQKYGRTTALTRGTVIGINATINVGYDSGTARFVNQIAIFSSRPFIKPGDSGSLLVTYPGRKPVGLIFAGNASGSYAFANPIGPVLTSFGVTIDGD